VALTIAKVVEWYRGFLDVPVGGVVGKVSGFLWKVGPEDGRASAEKHVLYPCQVSEGPCVGSLGVGARYFVSKLRNIGARWLLV